MGAPYVLEMKHITKRYGDNVVLSDVSLMVKPGEIHALLGENGAGKSTLMNILFGMPVIHAAGGFEGEVLLEGEKTHITSPYEAMKKGIGMVHQEFMLLPGFTVTENIKLNRETTRTNVFSRLFSHELETLDMKAMSADARSALDSVGMSIDEFTRVDGMPVGYMQFVEIAREIDKKGIRLLVFDEPTAVLTESEAAQLVGVMKAIARQGIAIIFITHRLDEVIAAADAITILRDGRLAAVREVQQTTMVELAELMIGRKGESVVSVPSRQMPPGQMALQVRDLKVSMPGEEIRGVSFDVFAGEIFGIGGLAGQGKLGIPNGIMSLYPSAGEVTLFDKPLKLGRAGDALTAGIAMVSEDRKGVGLVLETLVKLNREQGMTIVMVSSELQELRSICDRIAIVSEGKLVATLSPQDSDADFDLAMSGINPDDPSGKVGQM